LEALTKDAGIAKRRTFNIMYSLSFLIVELETARKTLLDVFEVSNGTPQWTWHAALSGWAMRQNWHFI
jgi:hypothetical protein